VSSSFSLSLLYVVSSRLNAAFVPVTSSACTGALSVLSALLRCLHCLCLQFRLSHSLSAALSMTARVSTSVLFSYSTSRSATTRRYRVGI